MNTFQVERKIFRTDGNVNIDQIVPAYGVLVANGQQKSNLEKTG